MNIVITGFMASGKSRVSRVIAATSEFKMIDTDDMITDRAGISINEIFDKYGEEYFRMLEHECVCEAAAMDNVVISTGGGVVLNEDNMEVLRRNGMIFNMSPSFEVIEMRLKDASATRPLLRDSDIEEVRERFENRKPYYDNCDYKVRVSFAREAEDYAAEILEAVRERQMMMD